MTRGGCSLTTAGHLVTCDSAIRLRSMQERRFIAERSTSGIVTAVPRVARSPRLCPVVMQRGIAASLDGAPSRSRAKAAAERACVIRRHVLVLYYRIRVIHHRVRAMPYALAVVFTAYCELHNVRVVMHNGGGGIDDTHLGMHNKLRVEHSA